MTPIEFPCFECGRKYPSKDLLDGRCLNCAYAWEDTPLATTTVELEAREEKNCVSCGRMHDLYGELCGPCVRVTAREHDRTVWS